MSYSRTTFFIVEVCGPRAPLSVGVTHPEYARIVRLAERSSTIKTGHRAGAWSAAALRRLADRAGVQLVSAYSIARKAWR